MKLAIVGCRDFTDYARFWERVECESGITEIVSGGAKGADAMAARYAEETGLPLKIFAADWRRLGRAAGPIRNRDLVAYADCVLAFWDGKSGGTRDAIAAAAKLGKPCTVYRIDRPGCAGAEKNPVDE